MKVKNSYNGGLDQDISKQKYPENKIYDCFDFRILTDEGLSTGALENVKGNILDFDIISDFTAQGIAVTTNIKVIGSSLVREETVLFAVDEVAGIDYIAKVFKNNLGIKEVKCIWLSSAITGRLNFSITYPITDEVPRYENSKVKKTYFTDNNNSLRWLNIKTLEDDIDSNGGLFSSITAMSFDILPVSNLTMPKLVEVLIGGARQSGMIQYYYQVYFPNGSISNLSPGTGLIHLTTTSEQLSITPWSQKYFGEDPGVDTGKAVKILIDGIPSNFDRVRIIAAHYSTYFDTPIIEIVYEGSLSNGSIGFIDTGNTVLGTLTLEELRLLEKGEFTCKGLTTKNNYLIAANIKELILDNDEIRNYDTRVYRFNQAGEAKLFEEDGSYYLVNGGTGSWDYYNSSDVYQNLSGVSWSIPEDADCINRMNDNSNDNNPSYRYMYYSDGQRIGAEGKNLKLRTYIKQLQEAEISGPDKWYVKPTIETINYNGNIVENTSYPNYASPMIHELFVGYKRGETYRFGIRFIDSKGRKSLVKWMCDFRMPLCGDVDSSTAYLNNGIPQNDYLLTAAGNLSGTNQPETKVNVLGLELSYDYNSIPSDPYINNKKCSIEIVRAERTSEDKSIIASGYLNSLYPVLSTEDYYDYPPASVTAILTNGVQGRLIFGSYVWNGPNTNRFHFYTPECSYFKDIPVFSTDKLQIQQVFDNLLVGNPTGKAYVQCRKSLFSPSLTDMSLCERDILGGKYNEWKPYGHGVLVNGNSLSGSYRSHPSYPAAPGSWAEAGSNISLQLSNHIHEFSDLGNAYQRRMNHIIYADIKRNLVKQYGGNTYDNRKLTKYITTNAFIAPQIFTDGLTFDQLEKLNIFGGDTYLGLYEFMSAMYSTDANTPVPSGKGYVCSVMGVVESSINGQLQGSEHTFKAAGNYFTQEKAGVYYIASAAVTQVEDIFLYNSVYSKQNNTLISYEMPIDFNNDDRVDVMVRISDKKFNGELFDSWLSWGANEAINEAIEVDTQYGPITGIDMCFDRIFTIQEKAVSIITLVDDQSQLTLSLGAGTKLNKYDYVTTKSGSKHQQSIIVGRKGLYYYDVLNNAIQSIKGISPEVTIPGLSSFLSYNTPQSIYDSDNPFLTGSGSVLAVLDINFDEVLFTFKDIKKTFAPSTGEFTIAVNESSGLFHHRYGCYPDLWIPGNGEYFSMEQRYNTNQRGKLYLHNKGLRGMWYGQPATNSYVILLINPLKGNVAIFNNLTWYTEVTNAGVDVYDLTLTSYRAWNDYQNTGTITLDNNNIDSVGAEQRIMRQWKTDIERDTSTGAMDEPRMRDTYILLQLNFTNQQSGVDNRMVLHDVITSITPSSF